VNIYARSPLLLHACAMQENFSAMKQGCRELHADFFFFCLNIRFSSSLLRDVYSTSRILGYILLLCVRYIECPVSCSIIV
jgi:hypothetical protein